jgi:hypothetical protein
MPHLAVLFSRPDMQAAVDGSAAGCPAWPCRSVGTTLPPSRVSAAPDACGQLVSTARPPSTRVRAVDVRRLRRPGPEPQQVSAEPDSAAVPQCRWVRLGAAPDGRCPPRTPPQPLQQGRRGYCGRRSPTIQAHPPGCGSGHRPSPADPARVSEVLAELRSPGDAVRTAGWWPRRGCPSAADLDAASVHCPPLRLKPQRCPDSRCPPGTLPQSAPVRGYRNRSPARRPLDGCRHCR